MKIKNSFKQKKIRKKENFSSNQKHKKTLKRKHCENEKLQQECKNNPKK